MEHSLIAFSLCVAWPRDKSRNGLGVPVHSHPQSAWACTRAAVGALFFTFT